MAKKMFYSMGEVAEMFDVRPSLLRHWEAKFDILRPHKNKKGNRMFTPEDVDNLKIIYHLVKERGMTLAGAAQHLKQGVTDSMRRDMELLERLQRIRAELAEVREQLKGVPEGVTVVEVEELIEDTGEWAEKASPAENPADDTPPIGAAAPATETTVETTVETSAEKTSGANGVSSPTPAQKADTDQAQNEAPTIETDQTLNATPAPETDLAQNATPVPDTDQTQNAAAAIETDQTLNVTPAPETDQAQNAAAATDADQAQNATPIPDTGRMQDATPATETDQAQNAAPVPDADATPRPRGSKSGRNRRKQDSKLFDVAPEPQRPIAPFFDQTLF